jgi:hypothetical protein
MLIRYSSKKVAKKTMILNFTEIDLDLVKEIMEK